MALAAGMVSASLHCTEERKEASQVIQLLIPCFYEMKGVAANNELWCTRSMEMEIEI